MTGQLLNHFLQDLTKLAGWLMVLSYKSLNLKRSIKITSLKSA